SLIIILKRLTTAFFISVIFKFGQIGLRFVFYKIVVKIYKVYLQLIRKLGWKIKGRRLSSSSVNQKIIHFIIIFLTILFVSLNLIDKTQAIYSEESIRKTFLSKIVTSEFDNNDQLIEEYFNKTAQVTLEQQTYLENLPAFKSQPMAKMIFPDELETIINEENLIQANDAIIKPNLVTTERIKQQRDEIIYYIVEPSDTISTIAANFGISVNTILWENNLSAYSLIRPGDKLTILPMSGITYKVKSGDTIGNIAKTYGVETSIIIETNKLAASGQLKIGQQLIILGGKKDGYIKRRSVAYTGLTIIQNLLKPKATSPLSGNKMNWPTVGHYITQYYSWRHQGLDIANKIGTPLYAADAGVIETAGWGRGYGNQIVINHGGGKKTRYAHLSKFYTKKGQKVDKGEAIGTMGSTGRSTGPHLHFEIIINNIKYNPLNYIR
ncbi:peptidoglycan DD-metalloendopeptidase family protein, partial [Patescibacteria group bacterium]|nr:peptidoglycan DD-metalloendopeptidase family protein [Patescibacteria group bacterium]